MKFRHICIVARDAEALAGFYMQGLSCEIRRPGRTLSGEKVGHGIGRPDTRIYSIWLSLPGIAEPFLEIHQYGSGSGSPIPSMSEPGYRHLAFETDDLPASCAGIVTAGGSLLGNITNFGTAETPVLLIYVRDPEGNILELEQRPQSGR